MLSDINETLPTIHPMIKQQRSRQLLRPDQPIILQSDAPLPFDEDQTAIKQIEAQNIQDNRNIMERTIPTPNIYDNTITILIEECQLVDMNRHFPCHHPLTLVFTKDLPLKTRRDVPNQKVNGTMIQC